MLLLNFSHPLTSEQITEVEKLTGQVIGRVVDVPVQVDAARGMGEQVVEIAERTGLTPTEWQTLPLVVNPPGYAPVAMTLLAELHGRMGYFPLVLWVQAVSGSVPQQFRVGEVIQLQQVREQARTRRQG